MTLHRVYGPPGTGKTTFLAHQAERAAALHGATGVAICSMTRAAAHEIGSRATGIPSENVGTLHAHAYRSLGHPELADTPAGIKRWNDQAIPGWRCTATGALSHGTDELYAPTGGSGLMLEVSKLRSRMTPVAKWPPAVRAFWQAWSKWKADNVLMDFGDLIERAADVPMHCRPHVLMVDEAQDMGHLEMRLVSEWGSDAGSVVVVGDSDQNLYQWRGSDPEAFTGVHADTERVLSQSHRVPIAVHAYAVQWIERVRDRPPVHYQPTTVQGDVRRVRVTYDDPAKIVRHAASLYADTDATGDTLMILGSCQYHVQPAVEALLAAGVPFHNPYAPQQAAWNPQAGARRLLAFLRPQRAVWGAEARLWTISEAWAWIEPLAAAGVLTRGAKTALREAARAGRFEDASHADDPADPQLVASLFASPSDVDAVGRGDVAWYAERIAASWRERFAFSLSAHAAGRLAALRATPRIIIGTINSVKGGEADEVVVFPDVSKAAWNGDERGEGWANDDTDPLTRLYYVACTRARKRLVIATAGSDMAVPLYTGKMMEV